MARFSPLYLALLAAQHLAEQLGQTRGIVQQFVVPPLQGRSGVQPVTTQLAHAKQTVQFLTEQLAHDAREQEGGHQVTTQLARATATAQVLVEQFAQSRESLKRLAEQLTHTQTTLRRLTQQLQHEVDQSPGGPFLEEPLGQAC